MKERSGSGELITDFETHRCHRDRGPNAFSIFTIHALRVQIETDRICIQNAFF